ncbi:hypothetical protein RJ639_030080 [Escallonia herrerae]|uniref:Kinesin motor domain-containing protein n=1 Tax=Escallonia herrerae TaxID=1293975 RepID=A0AA89BHY3_9ASTE|nr:hypothetical protein RJ639_030080 [Escallonia herrerae]
MADPDRAKPNLCSNPSQKVRIVAKLRGLTEQESGSLNGSSTPLISVCKPNNSCPSDKVTISFGEQPAGRKDAFEVDYCYEQDEDVGLIYSREVKPLITGVLNGQNGCEERPGLLMLAMADVLSLSEEVGKLVTVSFYEVFQDHVYDLLDSRRCKVPVKSISEFHKLLYCGPHKPVQKIPLELPRRSHKGLMIHIISCDEKLNTKACKMNFVDLAGYEDARRNSSDGISLAESTRINKSLYSLMNVVYALNANESRVPYRESKLTRMLQDSLGGANFVLMLTCLNPVLWQDTMYTLSLASRSCQSISRFMDSTIKSKSSAKPLVPSSFKFGKSASSFKSGKFTTVSATIKKEMTRSRVHLHEKRPSSMVKGRKLFDDGKDMISSEQGTFFSSAIQETEPTTKDDKDGFRCTESNHVEVTSGMDTDRKALVLFEDGCGMGKENKILMNEDGSPPLSVRLQELEELKGIKLEDLQEIGLSEKQVTGMMKRVAGELFS